MTTPSTSLRPGLRLASQVCSTEIIVVRAGRTELALSCGGVPMRERGGPDPAGSGPGPDPDRMRGSVLGKRYTHPDDAGIEVLVTVAGAGSLAGDGVDLVVKDAKPLPASD